MDRAQLTIGEARLEYSAYMPNPKGLLSAQAFYILHNFRAQLEVAESALQNIAKNRKGATFDATTIAQDALDEINKSREVKS